MRRTTAALFAITIVLASCGSDDDGSTDDPPVTEPPPTEPAETEAATTEPAAGEQAAGETVEVSLVEWAVEAPSEYAAGSITFNATNGGEFNHELVVIAADGYDSLPKSDNGEVLEDDLAPGALIGRTERFEPGDSMSLTVDLEPGSYVLLCNIAFGPNSHAGAGQTLDVTVG